MRWRRNPSCCCGIERIPGFTSTGAKAPPLVSIPSSSGRPALLGRGQQGGRESEERIERDMSWHCLPLGARALARRRCASIAVDADVAGAGTNATAPRPWFATSPSPGPIAAVEPAGIHSPASRDRTAACVIAVVGVARPALAAVDDHRQRREPGFYRDQLSAEDQRQLARDILGEGRRLTATSEPARHDAARPGRCHLESQWIGLDDIVGTATQRVTRVHPAGKIALQLPERLRCCTSIRHCSSRRCSTRSTRRQVLAGRRTDPGAR